jgi:hypothetical protein
MILLLFGWVQLHGLHGSLAPSGVFGVLELPYSCFWKHHDLSLSTESASYPGVPIGLILYVLSW